MGNRDYETNLPSRLVKPKKRHVPEDDGESRFAKVRFKTYIQKVKEDEGPDVQEAVHCAGKTELTEQDQLSIVQHFLEWSGGDYPDSMLDSDLQEYVATHAMDGQYDSDVVLKFLRNYVQD